MEAKEHGDSEKHELRAKLEAATEKAKEVCKRLQEQPARQVRDPRRPPVNTPQTPR